MAVLNRRAAVDGILKCMRETKSDIKDCGWYGSVL